METWFYSSTGKFEVILIGAQVNHFNAGHVLWLEKITHNDVLMCRSVVGKPEMVCWALREGKVCCTNLITLAREVASITNRQRHGYLRQLHSTDYFAPYI